MRQQFRDYIQDMSFSRHIDWAILWSRDHDRVEMLRYLKG